MQKAVALMLAISVFLFWGLTAAGQEKDKTRDICVELIQRTPYPYTVPLAPLQSTPIDGTYTMSLDGISEITRRLRSSVVLPMHRFATPLGEFMRRIGQQFEIDQRSERSLKISRDTLPGTPTVIILSGV